MPEHSGAWGGEGGGGDTGPSYRDADRAHRSLGPAGGGLRGFIVGAVAGVCIGVGVSTLLAGAVRAWAVLTAVVLLGMLGAAVGEFAGDLQRRFRMRPPRD